MWVGAQEGLIEEQSCGMAGSFREPGCWEKKAGRGPDDPAGIRGLGGWGVWGTQLLLVELNELKWGFKGHKESSLGLELRSQTD